jgi:hypothetical protein
MRRFARGLRGVRGVIREIIFLPRICKIVADRERGEDHHIMIGISSGEIYPVNGRATSARNLDTLLRPTLQRSFLRC